MTNKQDEAVKAALETLRAAAIAEGERSVARLSRALSAYADTLEGIRDEMQADTSGLTCTCCGREWTYPVTVKHEREWSFPDMCPICWNAKEAEGPYVLLDAAGGKAPRRSIHTETFRYTDKPKAVKVSPCPACTNYGSNPNDCICKRGGA